MASAKLIALSTSTQATQTVPAEAWIFLAATTVLLLLVILAILYLEQIACFKYCGGVTCFDVASDEAGEDLDDEDKSESVPLKM